MSGRIRTLKPEWLEDERLAMGSSDARVLSIALVLLADDHGNGRANPVQLAGSVFPGKPLETLAKALEYLASFFVTLYEVDGQSYFSIRNWAKHQRVDKPGKPKVPLPSELSRTFANIPEDDGKVRASRASLPLPSLPDPDPDPRSDARPPEEPDRQANWDGADDETPCPLDLVARARKVGVFRLMAERLKVTEDQVESKGQEFVTYWTIGKGMGRRKKFWMRELREDIRQAHERGRLKPPGMVEHEAFDDRPGLTDEDRERLRRVREELDRKLEESRKQAANG